jgi:outer membrane protein assembly factor BamE
MYKLIFTALLGIFLSSCALFHIHRVEIQQGNVMSRENVNRLHAGMSENQVKAIMGPPVLINILHNGRINYVYTSELGSSSKAESVVLTFSHGSLQNIQREGI